MDNIRLKLDRRVVADPEYGLRYLPIELADNFGKKIDTIRRRVEVLQFIYEVTHKLRNPVAITAEDFVNNTPCTSGFQVSEDLEALAQKGFIEIITNKRSARQFRMNLDRFPEPSVVRSTANVA